MSTLELLDANAGFLGVTPGHRHGISTQEHLQCMQHARINSALVRITPPAFEKNVPRSNQRLYAACRTDQRLIPCPILLPNSGHDIGPEDEQVNAAIQENAGAVWLRPGLDLWNPEAPWIYRPLLAALEARRMPVFVDYPSMALTTIAQWAESHPRLPLLIANPGYREHRNLLGLLEHCANTYLVLGGRTATHNAIESIVRHTSDNRILFGTGLPETEPMSAIAYLMYADLDDTSKAQIAAGNMVALMEDIR